MTDNRALSIIKGAIGKLNKGNKPAERLQKLRNKAAEIEASNTLEIIFYCSNNPARGTRRIIKKIQDKYVLESASAISMNDGVGGKGKQSMQVIPSEIEAKNDKHINCQVCGNTHGYICACGANSCYSNTQKKHKCPACGKVAETSDFETAENIGASQGTAKTINRPANRPALPASNVPRIGNK